MFHKSFPTYEHDYSELFDSQFGPLPEVVGYDTYIVDPQYGRDLYWDEYLYSQDKLEYKDTHNKPNDQIESNDLKTDSHISNALQYTLIDLFTVNPNFPIHLFNLWFFRDHKKLTKGKLQSSTTNIYHSSR